MLQRVKDPIRRICIHVCHEFYENNTKIAGGLRGCAVYNFGCVTTFRSYIVPPSSALKIEALCSSETLAHIQSATLRNNPEDHHQYSNRRENLKS